MKIIEINKCPDCNGKGNIGYYKSKKGKISRIISGVQNGISWRVEMSEKDYLKKKDKSFTIGYQKCSKCKGTGETKKITIKNRAKGIKIYNTEVKGWEIIK